MRFSTCLFVSSLALATLGCDPTGTPDAESRARLQETIKAFEDANSGFVPTDAQGQPRLSEYRTTQLAALRTDLQNLSSSGPQDVRSHAFRLLSDIETSESLLLAMRGEAAFASLSVEAVQAIGLVDTVGTSTTRTGLMDVDESAAAAAMREEAEKLGQSAEKASQQAATFRRERDRLAAERERVRTVYEQSVAEQVELKNQAALKSGEEKYALLERAAEAEKRANLATTQTERFDTQIFSVETKLATAEAERRGFAETAAALRDRAQKTSAANENRAQALRVSEQIATDARDRLIASASAVIEKFDETVDPQLVNAMAKAEKAVDHLRQARNLADRSMRGALDHEVLVKLMEQLHTATSRVQTLSAYRALLSPIQDELNRLGMSDQVVSQAMGRIDTAIATAIDQVRPSMDEATELSGRLAEGSDASTLEGRRIQRQVARIEAYVNKLGG